MACPPYQLTTGVLAGLEHNYIKTVTVVTTNAVDQFGMVVDRDGLAAIRADIVERQHDTHPPPLIVFVRAKIVD